MIPNGVSNNGIGFVEFLELSLLSNYLSSVWTDPTEMTIAVITGHGVHVHRRLTKDGPGVPRDRQTAISRANRPKTTPNRGAGQTLPRRPLTAVETSSQAQNRHLTNVDTKDAPGTKIYFSLYSPVHST